MAELWTIGHSTRTLEEFLEALASFRIETLVDVRRFPASRRNPHYKTDPLKRALHGVGIRYAYLGDELGGFRKPAPDSPHVALEGSAFQGYADHLATPIFRQGVTQLLSVAERQRCAFMCAERLPASCHRRILSDYLALVHGATIHHILDPDAAKPHALPPTVRRTGEAILYAPARLTDFPT